VALQLNAVYLFAIRSGNDNDDSYIRDYYEDNDYGGNLNDDANDDMDAMEILVYPTFLTDAECVQKCIVNCIDLFHNIITSPAVNAAYDLKRS
jgi:hypothetical protein